MEKSLPMAPVVKKPSTAAESPTSRKRYKLVTSVKAKKTISLNHTCIDPEIEEVQSARDKEMELINQAYQPKRCLEVKSFTPGYE